MGLGFRMGGVKTQQTSGIIVPASRAKFSQLYADAGASITCAPNYIRKTGNNAWGHVATIDSYDFTNYSTLTFNVTIDNYSGNDLFLGYATQRPAQKLIYNYMTHVDKSGNGTYTVTMDISGRTGYYFIIIGSGNLQFSCSSVILS